MQLAIHTEKVTFERWVFSDMQSPCFFDGLLFAFGQPLLLQQIFGPRRNHHLKAIAVYSVKIFMKTPAECAVTQMNKANLS